jgi:hypothetical protein
LGELKTEPGWKQPRERKPWWAVAFAGGFGAVLAVLFSLGFISAQARGGEPRAAATSVAPLPSGSLSLDERLARMESTLKTLSDDMIEVKTRLPKKRGE